jgi:hypothetical protein
MGLFDINARWAKTGHPHAILHVTTGQWHGYCPTCDTTFDKGHDAQLGAMNDAIAHKNQCGARQTG